MQIKCQLNANYSEYKIIFINIFINMIINIFIILLIHFIIGPIFEYIFCAMLGINIDDYLEWDLDYLEEDLESST